MLVEFGKISEAKKKTNPVESNISIGIEQKPFLSFTMYKSIEDSISAYLFHSYRPFYQKVKVSQEVYWLF